MSCNARCVNAGFLIVSCGPRQIATRVKDALEPSTGLKQQHLPKMKEHVMELREEIIGDAKPLSRVNIISDDDDLLAVLGSSGIRMADASQSATDKDDSQEVSI